MAKKQYLDLTGLTTYDEEIKAHIDGIASGKANSSHNHAASNITSGTLSSDRLPTVPITKGGTGATTAAGALTNLGLTATAAELNKMDGVTATTTELNYVDGVTSNIQTQLNAKVPTSRTVNGKALSANITLSASDVGADASGSASSALTSAKSYTDGEISKLVNNASTETLDSIAELADAIEENDTAIEALNSVAASKANASDLTSHTGNTSNPHGVTKAQVGLGNVENKSSATIRGELTKSNVTTALGYTPPTTNTTYGVVSTTADGLAPKLAGGTTKYLREDGTWAVPPDTNTTYSAGTGISLSGTTFSNSGVRSIATGSSNGTISVNTNGTAADVAVKGLAAAAYKAVTDSSSASAISTGTSLVTERDVYYGLPKINNSNSYTRSTTIYAPTAGGTSGYILTGNGTTSAPVWKSQADTRTNLGFTYGTSVPTSAPSTGAGAVCFVEDIHATLPITEGGTGATSVDAARANLKLNHVGASAVCKGSESSVSVSAGAFYQIKMVASNLITTDSNFTVANNGIQCPYDGTVYITGSVYLSSSVGNHGCYIYKNGGELHSQYISATSGAVTSGGMLVSVVAGDIITMQARSSVAGTVGPANKATHLTVIYVD